MNAKKTPFFIKSPLLWILIGGTITLLTFSLNKYFFKSIPAKHVNQQNPTTLFLENLMVREGGLFTLLGSKPVTEFDIQSVVEESEQDLIESYENLRSFLEKTENEKGFPEKEKTAINEHGVTLPSFKDYKSQYEKHKEMLASLDKKKLWEDWIKKNKTLDPKFLIFSRVSPYAEEDMGLFVNIPNLVYTLHHYYEIFSTRTQIEFDPSFEASQIIDSQSIFWDKIFKDHFLTGLIFGYGERSAFLYDWSNKHLSTVEIEKRFFFNNDAKISQRLHLQNKSNISPSDLPLPTFFHFGICDPTELKYKAEKKEIAAFFQAENYIAIILELLQGSISTKPR